MKITTQLVTLTLSLLLVNADQYCDNLVKECREKFQAKCSAQNTYTLKSCCDLKIFSAGSGVYKMSKAFDIANAYCDMTTDGGGWIVIQRNKNNSKLSFNKNWTDYEEGFGDLNTEFWYGLESMHCLTRRGQWEMRVDYQFKNKTWSYLHYKQFSVGSATEEYPLTVGGFTGVGTDWFNYQPKPHNGMKFTTPDNDNDKWSIGNCAATHKSGWWYYKCYQININKQPPSVLHYYGGLIIYNINTNTRTPPIGAGNVLFSEMKIRPKDCITQ